MPTARVSRGRATQELTAAWFRERGWPNASSRAASLPGVDITGMPGLAPEVKATRGENLTGALRQAAHNADIAELPFVVFRPAGYGPARIEEWLVAISLEDFTSLLHGAGL